MVYRTGHRATNLGRPDTTYSTSADNNTFSMKSGIHLAKVIDNSDPTYNGALWVEIMGRTKEESSDTQEERHANFTKIRQVQSQGGTITGENYGQQYGASFSPPSIGSQVLVAFSEGHQEGYLLGTLIPAGNNASIPGISASEIEGEEGVVGPTLEQGPLQTQEGNTRTRHPLAEKIALQGTALDPVRGIGSEGARRESPSRVSGFSSPSGHSFVMDDGTEEFNEGVNYTPDPARQAGSNNLIRLRSAGGAQILLNDGAGIVYITSQSGNSWIQMDSEGNVDIHSSKTISYYAEDTVNFYAGDAFNIEADVVNIKARGDSVNIESASEDINLYASKNVNATGGLNLNLKSSGDILASSDGNIHLNGPIATEASKATPEPMPVNRGVKESIVGRVPEREPYGGHKSNSFYVAAQARSSPQTGTKDLSTEA